MTGSGDKKNIKYDYEHFTMYELAEGVFAAIEKGTLTGSNAGIIDLGDYNVIFDTFLNIDAARELKSAGEELTGKSAGFIINSHSHTDHIIGNCIYSHNVPVISSKRCRELISEFKKEFGLEKGQYEKRIEEIENAISTADDTETGNLNNELKFLVNLVKPDVDVRLPDITLDKEMTLYGSKRRIVLTQYDSAHSKGDVVAYLPDDKICFTGDLLFAESQPWLGSGDPEQLIHILEGMMDYEIEQFVPGHGRLAVKRDVFLQIRYINEIIQLVKEKESFDVNDYSVDELSPTFKNWKGLCFSWNINFLIERMKVGSENSR